MLFRVNGVRVIFVDRIVGEAHSLSLRVPFFFNSLSDQLSKELSLFLETNTPAGQRGRS